VDVALVSDVEYYFIFGRIENTVERERKLNGAKVCRQMSAVFRNGFQKRLSYLACEQRELRFVQCFKIARGIDFFEDHNLIHEASLGMPLKASV
jgi:hypothetical protein